MKSSFINDEDSTEEIEIYDYKTILYYVLEKDNTIR